MQTLIEDACSRRVYGLKELRARTKDGDETYPDS